MIRPAIETARTASLIAAAVYLKFFGHLTLSLSPNAERYLSLGAGLLGLWFAAGLWSAYPTWRRGFLALTGALLACVGVMFLVAFGGSVIR